MVIVCEDESRDMLQRRIMRPEEEETATSEQQAG